jgi:hypothetical protein
VSDPFPTILDGVPLQIRTVSVTVDRPFEHRTGSRPRVGVLAVPWVS